LENANTPTEISDDDESFKLDDDQVETDALAVKNRDEIIKKELNVCKFGHDHWVVVRLEPIQKCE